ncbi:MAG: flagellar biosynthesis protein FlhF [bacterium]
MAQKNDYKTYSGDTHQKALMKVKQDLGTEAKIIESREVTKGGFLGFFGEQVYEVDAYRPPQSKNGTRTTTNNQQSSTRSRQSTFNNGNGTNRRNSSNGKKETQAGNNEWNVDEPAMPSFSSIEQAAKLIEEKSRESEEGVSGNQTYDRPRSNRTSAQENNSSGKRNTNGPMTTGGSSGTSNGTKPGLDNNSDVDEERFNELLENTDLLVEKVDHLMDSIDHDEQQRSDNMEPNYPGVLSDLYVELLQEDINKKHSRDLISRIRRNLEADQLDDREAVEEELRREIRNDFTEAEPLDTDLDAPILVPFVGPTGVGKTTTLAKLAAHFSLEENRKVGFVTLDQYRLAAVEQLRKYAEIIQVPVKDVVDEHQLKNAVDNLVDNQVEMVFMDTAGRSQFDSEKISDLQDVFPSEYDVETHLVLSATSRSSDLESVLSGFSGVDIDRLVVTKLDETRCHGSIYNLLEMADQPLAYFTDGQDVPDDLWIADGEHLADLLLEGES